MKLIIRSCVLLVLLTISTLQHSHAQATELKVMAYNIWNGFNWGKDTLRRDSFISWIQSKNLDVLALQELCGYNEEKLKRDAKKWGHNYAVILKDDGYPVGLTSREPIVVKEKVREGMWHGMLHAQTFGIDFFVVHLSPADVDFRHRESDIIIDRIRKSESERYIVLGDFNSHSPFDADLNSSRPDLFAKYNKTTKDSKYSNLRLQEFDYSVISNFLSLPAIDVSMKYVMPDNRYSFPSPVLIGSYRTPETVLTTKERIDYILADPKLAKLCIGSTIYNRGSTEAFSDHYPVMATFFLKTD